MSTTRSSSVDIQAAAMLILLAACAVLGFFSFWDLFRSDWGIFASKDALTTLGVSAYIFANAIIYKESGLAALLLVTLLGWLTNVAVRRTPRLAKWQQSTPIISVLILLIYIGVYTT